MKGRYDDTGFRDSVHELRCHSRQGDGGSLSEGGFSGILPTMIYLDHNAHCTGGPGGDVLI